MTGQFSDIFIFNNESYEIAGLSGKGHFIPENYELEPYSTCTACWRGYLLTYTIYKKSLVLENLKINLKEEKIINGKKSQAVPDNSLFKFEYDNLDLQLNFSGSILIAKDMVPGMYVHMGFQRPIAYKTVIELEFKDGQLISTKDLSEEIAQERKENPNKDAKPKSPFGEDIKNWIVNTFSLDHKKKTKDKEQ